MTIFEEIISIANNLADQGKKPSVALIKTQLSQPAPLPVIIKVLKNWQHQPNQPRNVEKTTTAKITTTDTFQLTAQTLEQIINQALAPIQAELMDMKHELTTLKKQINLYQK
jgi:hypothetical protein